MPGTAACAAEVRNRAVAATAANANRASQVCFILIIIVVAMGIVALLLDYDLGHHAAEVFGVIRQVIQVGGVEEVGSGGNACGAVATGIAGRAGIENYVGRLPTTHGDGIGVNRKST